MTVLASITGRGEAGSRAHGTKWQRRGVHEAKLIAVHPSIVVAPVSEET
jgi:hypothetical protein